jgi:hypothetical protein
MNFTKWQPVVIVAMAVAFLGPVSASAQRFGDQDDRRLHRVDLGDEVDKTFHDSKDFRHYFEHNFRSNGHEPRWDLTDASGHPEHEGRYGQITLKDAIQNTDEDIERLRAEFAHHGTSRAALELAAVIRRHTEQVDVRLSRTGDWYRHNSDRHWRWERSELNTRWADVRSDIRRMTRDILARR